MLVTRGWWQWLMNHNQRQVFRNKTALLILQSVYFAVYGTEETERVQVLCITQCVRLLLHYRLKDALMLNSVGLSILELLLYRLTTTKIAVTTISSSATNITRRTGTTIAATVDAPRPGGKETRDQL